MRSPTLRPGGRGRGSSRRLLVAPALLLAPLLVAPAAQEPPAVGPVAPAALASAAGPEAPPPAVSSETFGLDALTTGKAGDRVTRSTTADGSTIQVEVAAGTQSVGLSWAGAQVGDVEVRGRTTDATWTAWQHLHGDPAEGPDRSERTGTQLGWLASEGVDAVEVRTEPGMPPLPDLELQAIRAELPSESTTTTSAAASAVVDGRPTIRPRSEWTTKGWVPTNPDCTPVPELAVTGARFAIVHHTDNPNGYSAADVPAILASIYAFHTGTNRWCDIAYNFLVDRFGRIWEGRSGGIANPIVGSHAKGSNRGSVGVALLGDHQAGSPSQAALTAAGQVIGWKLALHRRKPTTPITTVSTGGPRYPEGTRYTVDGVIGHRDVGLTTCPGALLYPQLDAIARTASSFQAALPAPSGPLAPFRSPSDVVLQQYRDVLRRDPVAGPFETWSARLGAGTSAPADLVSYLLTSPEADGLVHATTRLYRAYFGRNPDHAGFDYWARRRATGTTLDRISSTFAASSEFRTKYGSLTDAQFVDLVYANVLGRPADAAGRAYWVRKLAGGTGRGAVMLQFSQSSEFVRRTRSGTWVVATYESLLRRAVSDAAYAELTEALDAGTTSTAAVASSLLASESYRKRIAPFS